MPPEGYEPFLAAICAAPDDDLPRLVYADWLDEHDEPHRAEFIRLQCELASRQRGGLLLNGLGQRQETLLRANYGDWWHELPRIDSVTWNDRLVRGFFIGADVTDPRKLLDWRDHFFSATPIQDLGILNVTGSMLARICEMPELRHLDSLMLTQCRVNPGEWEPLLTSRYLNRLHRLTITPAGVYSLGGVTGYPEPALTEDDAARFAAAPGLSQLRSLHFGHWISDQTRFILARRFASVHDNWL